MTPSKLELLARWLPRQQWYAGARAAPTLATAGGFRLDDPAGAVGIEFLFVTDDAGDAPVTYHVPMTYRGEPLSSARAALIGTGEHGVLGRRWIYDGVRDTALVEQLLALLTARAEPQHRAQSQTPDPTVTVHDAHPEPLTVEGFDVSDAPERTTITVRTGSAGAGAVDIEVARLLMPTNAPREAVGHPSTAVTAPWSTPHGRRHAGVVVSAVWEPGATS